MIWYKNIKSNFTFIYRFMKELEFLLNLLLKMGRKPWGKDVSKIIIPPKEEFDKDRYLFVDIMFSSGSSRYYTQRELVSINSWLRQFVCKNNLHKKGINNFREKVYRVWSNVGWFEYNYKYRLLESALIPEEELGQFLLDNIKAEWHLKYEIKLD